MTILLLFIYVNRFEKDKRGYMIEDDFVEGWLEIVRKEGNKCDYLKRAKYLVGEDNLLL